MTYDRDKAVAYAHKWALSRNPAYYNFNGQGGDCTNFASQCVYAGCGVMNYTRDTGWYYNSLHDRAAAWSGVEYLYRFLTRNRGPGPYGAETTRAGMRPGDLIQLSYDGAVFGHTLFIVRVQPNILVAQHSSENYDNRPFATYLYERARFIRVEGFNR